LQKHRPNIYLVNKMLIVFGKQRFSMNGQRIPTFDLICVICLEIILLFYDLIFKWINDGETIELDAHEL